MKFLKGLALFAAGVVTATNVSVMAEQATRNISVSYRNIKIYADGNLVNTSGANEAFIYNGTTYLPVRAVGEAYNKAVDWDAANSAVYLGKRPTGSLTPTVLLEDMDYFTKTADINELESSGKDNVGNVHGSGISVNTVGEIQYLLNGKYKSFSGTIGVSYNDRDYDDESTVKIFGDNKLLYSSPILTAGITPTVFNIDTSGVINLKIVVDGNHRSTETWINLSPQIYDAGFYS